MKLRAIPLLVAVQIVLKSNFNDLVSSSQATVSNLKLRTTNSVATNSKILKENGCEGKYGLALGLGLERILMVRKNIKDIRLLRSENEKVKCQMLDLNPYNEVSSMPPVVRDISVVVDKNLDIELLGDMIRDSSVDERLIEEVQILSETSYEELPDKAKERLGIEPNEKNILIRITLRSLERTLTNEECNEYRDIIYRHISTKEGYLTSK